MSEVKEIGCNTGKQLVDRIRFQRKQVSRRKKMKKIMKDYNIAGTGIFKLWERNEELRVFMKVDSVGVAVERKSSVGYCH